MELIYRPLAVVVKSIVRVMGWRILITNGEAVPATGAVIIAANHVSYLDPVMLGLATERHGRLPRYMAKRELFAIPVFGSLLRALRFVSVDRQGAAAQALPDGVARLQEGEMLGLFPEGTIHPSFDPANGKTGAARLALEVGAPLIAVGLWGGQAISTKGGKIRPRRRLPLAVHFSEPLTVNADDDAQTLTLRLMEQIGLLAEQARLVVEADARSRGK